LERHQTLRHAVAWSYDLLDDAEKTALERCSVFRRRIRPQERLRGSHPTTSTSTPSLICWMPWCASRCWSPTGLRGGPGSRCWRRSASFAEEQLVASGEATEVRTAHARYFAGREADIMALWGRPPAAGGLRLVRRRNWPIAHCLSVGSRPRRSRRGRRYLRHTRRFLGLWVEQYEPIAWAEELIEPARAVDHPKLGYLLVMATQCWMAGRIEAAVRYSDEGQQVS